MPGIEPTDMPSGASAAPPQRPPQESAQPPRLPAYPQPYPSKGQPNWAPLPPPPPPPAWVIASRAQAAAPVTAGTLWAAFAAATLSALLLGDGFGLNLLFVAVPAAVAAALAGRAAGRRPGPWALLHAAAGLGLLAVPALRDAGWPSFLGVAAAMALGSLALNGGRNWPGALLGTVGMWIDVAPGVGWAWKGLRELTGESRERWWPAIRAAGVAAGLVLVFGTLFAGADAAFADLLGNLVPNLSPGDTPLRVLFFVAGLVVALAAARAAAAPRRWDRVRTGPGRARGRLEWALPLVVLAVLFTAFNAVQLTVLFGGYRKVLGETGLSYSQYARQGFWQLLMVTLLILVVIAVALRWAPRGAARDRLLVRCVLGTLCGLTLVVIASALRRMELYVDAYGLTRLRISVAGAELWLGLVIVLIMAAGVFGSRWLPRAIVAGAAVGVLAFGLASPDGLIAQQQVTGYGNSGKIDLAYLRNLSADAVPALDRLPEPQRSCALGKIRDALEEAKPWYATSLGVARARRILAERPLLNDNPCAAAGFYGYEG